MNTVQLIGRLTKDPELRLTDGGTAVCTIRLAVPRRKRNGKEPPPNYIDVVTFAAHAEAIAEHMAKGRRVAVGASRPPGVGPRRRPALSVGRPRRP